MPLFFLYVIGDRCCIAAAVLRRCDVHVCIWLYRMQVSEQSWVVIFLCSAINMFHNSLHAIWHDFKNKLFVDVAFGRCITTSTCGRWASLSGHRIYLWRIALEMYAWIFTSNDLASQPWAILGDLCFSSVESLNYACKYVEHVPREEARDPACLMLVYCF